MENKECRAIYFISCSDNALSDVIHSPAEDDGFQESRAMPPWLFLLLGSMMATLDDVPVSPDPMPLSENAGDSNRDRRTSRRNRFDLDSYRFFKRISI